MTSDFGDFQPPSQSRLPQLKTPLPGPQSLSLGSSLSFEASGLSGFAKGHAPVIFEHGSGAILVDVDGNDFLDLTSSFGVAALGYAPDCVTRAVQSQAGRLQHTMAGIFPHEKYATLLARIARHFGRSAQPEVALATSGAEAIEIALKLAYRVTGAAGILTFAGGFHGQTLGTLKICGHNPLRNPFVEILGSSVTHLPYPNPFRPISRSADPLDLALTLVEAALAGTRSGQAPVGAIVVEPMQNPAGYVVPPRGFLAGLSALCKRYGKILIVDEIFTGAGRSGEWLLSDRESVAPDIVCVGKAMTGGLPLAAVVADRSLMACLVTDGLVPLHGSTFMGNPLACAASNASLEMIEAGGFVKTSYEVGARWLKFLRERLEGVPGVGDVRGSGLALAIEFVKDSLTKEPDSHLAANVANSLFKRGVIVLISGLPDLNVITMAPPFVIEEDQLAFAMEELVATIKRNTGAT
ncbi:MAG: aminotransferase class III-fold pyridoxal phosphate-dependent enzyme [Bryobacteraceae bacterium]